MSDEATTLNTAARPPAADAAPVVHVTIAWHPDVRRVGDQRLMTGARLELSRSQGDFHALGAGITGPLNDAFVSRTPLAFEADGGGLRVTPPAKVSVGGAPPGQPVRVDGAALDRGVSVNLRDRVVLWVHRRPPRVGASPAHGLIGQSAGLDEVRAAISRAAPTPYPVLVRGESGTGKELVARALHDASGRPGPFHAINLAAIPMSTAAAALFGHARGAFTGAAERKPGWFAASQGGTLLLDEIGEAAPELQALLLRVLETGEIQPIGENRTQRVDVRVVAATDAALEAALADGRFRAPLLHRLAALEIRLPPLRARPVDVGPLLRAFLERELADLGAVALLQPAADAPAWIPGALIERLLAHPWPGNVRELRNLARRIALEGAGRVQVDAVGLAAQLASPAIAHAAADAAAAEHSLDAVYAAMEAAGWSAHRASTLLAIPRTTLYRLLERDARIPKAADVDDQAFRDAFAALGDVDAVSARLRVSTRSVKQRLRLLGLLGGA